MRFFLLLGGFGGFALAGAGSLFAGNEPAFAVRDGAIGCLAGALLMRGMHFVFLRTIRSHLAERAASAQASPESNTQ